MVLVKSKSDKYRAAVTLLDILFLYKENPALDAGFRERYAFDQKSSES